jgi:hypothetical protein
VYLSLDRNLVDGDKVVLSSYFSACSDGGRSCHSAVLRGDHHYDVLWWSRWSELGGAARDVVDVVRWSRWSDLGGAARDVVDVVRWSRWPELNMARLWLGMARLLPNYGSTDLATDTPGRSSNDVMITAPPAKSSSNHVDMDIPNVYVYTFHRKVY